MKVFDILVNLPSLTLTINTFVQYNKVYEKQIKMCRVLCPLFTTYTTAHTAHQFLVTLSFSLKQTRDKRKQVNQVDS